MQGKATQIHAHTLLEGTVNEPSKETTSLQRLLNGNLRLASDGPTVASTHKYEDRQPASQLVCVRVCVLNALPAELPNNILHAHTKDAHA